MGYVSEGRGSGCNTGVSAHAAVHHVIVQLCKGRCRMSVLLMKIDEGRYFIDM
jgi:hypothetical protein